MNTYEKMNLLVSLFTAIGTCGATALALYFWLRENSLKLKCHVMHANGYGSVNNIDGGYLIVKFTNTGIKFKLEKYLFKKIMQEMRINQT